MDVVQLPMALVRPQNRAATRLELERKGTINIYCPLTS